MEAGQAGGLEPVRGEAAVLRVVRRVHLDEGADPYPGVALRGDLGVGGEHGQWFVGEQGGLAFDGEDFGMAEHRPERREAVASRNALQRPVGT